MASGAHIIRQHRPEQDKSSVSDFLREMREERPSLQGAWEETALARGVALTLVRMRRGAALNQRQLAAKANWDKSHVSRLESATNGVPDLATIVRYASACGATVSLVAARVGERGAQIESAIPLMDYTVDAPEAVLVVGRQEDAQADQIAAQVHAYVSAGA
jgi:transcriptional regulator with XRE-family HTH domain